MKDLGYNESGDLEMASRKKKKEPENYELKEEIDEFSAMEEEI